MKGVHRVGEGGEMVFSGDLRVRVGKRRGKKWKRASWKT